MWWRRRALWRRRCWCGRPRRYNRSGLRTIDLRWWRFGSVPRRGIPDGRVWINRWPISGQRSAVLQAKVQGVIGISAIASGAALHCRRTDYSLRLSASICGSNRFSAAPAKLRPGRIAATTSATEHFNRLRWAPVERSGSDRHATTPAKLRTRGIIVTTARTLHFCSDRLKSSVATPATELHALRKTRMTLRTHHDRQRRGMAAVFTVEATTARRRQLIARHAELELRFDDLFRNVTANLDHALIVRLTCL